MVVVRRPDQFVVRTIVTIYGLTTRKLVTTNKEVGTDTGMKNQIITNLCEREIKKQRLVKDLVLKVEKSLSKVVAENAKTVEELNIYLFIT